MKRFSADKMLPTMTVFWGVLALILRRQLYITGMDVKGLLAENHPLGIALTVLTIAALIRSALYARKWGFAGEGAKTMDARLAGALGNAAAGAGILVTVLFAAPMTGSYLVTLWYWLGLAAAICLLAAGVVRMFGKSPFFLLHVAACLFYLVHIVTHYQLWSSNPQMQDYLFAMLGAMALMLFAFYTAAAEADCGSPRMKLGVGLAAVYLCLGELARSSCPGLYWGGFLWVLTDLYSMTEAAQK